jgi:hypothetical protein
LNQALPLQSHCNEHVAAGLVLLCGNGLAANLSADDASRHAGESATVRGIVASLNYAARSKGQPTFLNLDKLYPNQIFTVVIWGTDRGEFGTPETVFQGKYVCTTGATEMCRGRPEIIVREPSQLKVKCASMADGVGTCRRPFGGRL